MITEDLPNGQPIASYEMLRDAVAATIAFLDRREDPVHPSRIATLLRSALDSAQLQYDQDRARWEQDRADKAAAVRVYENMRRKVEELQVESTGLRNQLYAKGVELDCRGEEIEKLRTEISALRERVDGVSADCETPGSAPTPASGTFTLTYGGRTTPAIAYNAPVPDAER